jgi:hypothetical protein
VAVPGQVCSSSSSEGSIFAVQLSRGPGFPGFERIVEQAILLAHNDDATVVCMVLNYIEECHKSQAEQLLWVDCVRAGRLVEGV